MRTLRKLLLVLAAAPFPACSGGTVDAQAWVRLSARNYEYYEDLLFPPAERDALDEIFLGRLPACEDADAECEEVEKESAGQFDMRLPYETDEVQGLYTQKGDLQITAHLESGAAFEALAAESWAGWDGLRNTAKSWGLEGDGCDEGSDPRSGAGRCWSQAVQERPDEFLALDPDLRLVILINLPGRDDTRDPDCAEVDADFSPADWALPRTLRLNQDVGIRGFEFDGDGDDEEEEGEDWRHFYDPTVVPPLAQCELEVFATLQLGPEQFAGDWFGETEYEEGRKDIANPTEDDLGEWEYELSAGNGTDELLLGTVELESLGLPDDDEPRATGRFRLRFESQRFPNRDGRIDVEGTFDVEVRRDQEAVTEPERQLDLGPQAEGA